MKSITFIIVLGVSIFFSCDDSTVTETDQILLTQKTTSDQERYDQLMDEPQKGAYTSDPFDLKGIRRDGSKLLIGVAYSGGCAEHQFELVWPEVITMIYPPSFSVILIHDNGKDLCEAYLSKTLAFDLSQNGLVTPEVYGIMDLTILNGSNFDEFKKLN